MSMLFLSLRDRIFQFRMRQRLSCFYVLARTAWRQNQYPERKKSAQAFSNNSAMRRSLTIAALRLAVYLDDGRLDRKHFSNYDAANYALLRSYRGKIKGGIQSFSRTIGYSAISLVRVRHMDLKNDNTANISTKGLLIYSTPGNMTRHCGRCTKSII